MTTPDQTHCRIGKVVWKDEAAAAREAERQHAERLQQTIERVKTDTAAQQRRDEVQKKFERMKAAKG